MDNAAHWNRVYQTQGPTEVSWYRKHLETSLALIEAAGGKAIIDVGGGHSALADHCARCSPRAPSAFSRPRELDLRRRDDSPLPAARYDVWHDRAVFHFLTDPTHRALYVQQVARSVRPGGHVIVGTFGPNGPLQCSGLDVVRYDADALHGEFGARFELVKHVEEVRRMTQQPDRARRLRAR
jgi:SAM-dependent methyltransferase